LTDFADQTHKPTQTFTPQPQSISPKEPEPTPKELTNGVNYDKMPKALQNSPIFGLGGPTALERAEAQRQLNAALPKRAQPSEPKQSVAPTSQGRSPEGSQKPSSSLVYGVDYGNIPKALQTSPVLGLHPAPATASIQGQANGVVPEQASQSEPKQRVDPTSQGRSPEGSQKPLSTLVNGVDYGTIPKALQTSPVFGLHPAPLQAKVQGQSNAAVPEQTPQPEPKAMQPTPMQGAPATVNPTSFVTSLPATKPTLTQAGSSPTLVAQLDIPGEGPRLPNPFEAFAAAGTLLQPLMPAFVEALPFIAPAVGIPTFTKLGIDALQDMQKKASPPTSIPSSSPAQSNPISVPVPVSAPVSVPRMPAKAQSPAQAVDQPSALDLKAQQQAQAQAAQAAQIKQQQAQFGKEMAASDALQAAQSKLNDFSSGFVLNGSDLDAFSQGLTPQQRQAVQAQATARNGKLTNLAQQAGLPLSKDEIKAQQAQLVQQVLYEQYTPAREIYHFGSKFLNGYTAEKMKAVRGYFDDVFAGTYPKTIPEGKSAGIEADADAKYTAETGKQVDRNSPLWKTLRNIEASEKYPDLWGGFNNDLSTAAQTAGVMGVPQPQVLTKPEGVPNPPPEQGDKRVPVLPRQTKKPGEEQQGSFLPKPIPDMKPKSDGELARNDPAQAQPVTSQAKDTEPRKENTANQPASAKKNETIGKKQDVKGKSKSSENNTGSQQKPSEAKDQPKKANDQKHWNEPTLVNGRRVYQQSNLFDPKTVDVNGLTNLQRMEKGKPPIGYDGEPVNLHHLTQAEPGSLAEVGGRFHEENTKILHGLAKPGQSFRHSKDGKLTEAEKAFNRYKYSYWKQRAEDFKK
jgi:A nuclease of the HNH/ENDO VII superfamily with conserved LHH